MPEKSEERRLACYPIVAVGLSMVAFILIKTARDAVFFSGQGLKNLPLAYVWIAIASIPAAMFHLKALDRWGARKTRAALFFITATLFFAFTPFTHPEQNVMMTLMFIIVPTIFAALFAGAWLLAGDLLEGLSQPFLRKTYTRIGAASMVGGICGGLLARLLSSAVEARWLLAAGAVILIGVGILVMVAHRRNSPEQIMRQRGLSESSEDDGNDIPFSRAQSQLFKEKYLHLLLGISALATIAGVLIDFQFYAAATITSHTNPAFFANFYIIINAAALAVQLLAAPRLQMKLGLGGALLLLPSALLGGSGVATLWTTLQARALMKVAEGGLKSSIHRSMWEQTYLPIARHLRDAAKTIVDGTMARVAEGAAALVLLIWFALTTRAPEELNYNWITWLIIAVIVVWLLLTRRLAAYGHDDIESDESVIRLPDG